jgi:glycosyltransferase involved in cell wall biosynthesis
VKRLIVEGWRFIPHSYALVNHWQLLSLLKRNDVSLSVRDAPYFSRQWRPTRGLFSQELEDRLAAIPQAGENDRADALLRMTYPYDFSLSGATRTAVFGTSEFKTLWPLHFRAQPDFDRLSRSPTFAVVTPSNWSREGFLRDGLREDQVHVVPHGVNIDTFRPEPRSRDAARRQFGLSGFTFGNASSMSPNKGIEFLLRAFAAVAARYPGVHLLLKGADGIYPSKGTLRGAIAKTLSGAGSHVISRIHYFGDTISAATMADFYRAIDVYVSPYSGEGFNLPVLEAMACGTPVICTKGGATDDFTDPSFSRHIDSKLKPIEIDGIAGFQLEPSVDHLIGLMIEAAQDGNWRKTAAVEGPKHAAKYNWDAVAARLLDAIFPSSAA